MKSFIKDPQAIVDYSFDWNLWLDGDTISTSVWVAESGLTKEVGLESKTNTITTLFVSGGGVGINYTLTNTITTAGGRTDERSVEIRVRDK